VYDAVATDVAFPLSPPLIRQLTSQLLVALGENPSRPGLIDTPRRVAESMAFLTSGYQKTAEQALGDALFDDPADDLVSVSGIEFYSLCEHHLLPFFGTVHIGYVPAGKIVGLSKLPRVVEVFARRLQVQERLTRQIAEALQTLLQPAGVGVVVEAQHLSMMMRGVQKQRSTTTTRCLLGTLRDDDRLRAEFLGGVHQSREHPSR